MSLVKHLPQLLETQSRSIRFKNTVMNTAAILSVAWYQVISLRTKF